VNLTRARTARALAAALAALIIAATAPERATATDINELRSRAQTAADRVTSLERRLNGLRTRRSELQAVIDAADRRMALLERRRQRSAVRYEEALAAYVEAAVDVYKSPSPGTNLEIILSAKDIADVVTLSKLTTSSADAAHQRLDELVDVRDDAIGLQTEVDERKQELLAAAADLDTVGADISAALARRRGTLRELNAEIAELERQARLAAESAAQPSNALRDLLQPSGPTTGIPPGFASTGVAFEGVASWYGPGFEGNHTANGDIFDPSLFTAASKELPLGSWLYVQHQGKGVVVYVNDRGPYVDDRVLDLSQAAAETIGITGLGWIRATIIIKV
jgi:predicted  nucleic acid-binding Zn-ribbon protein